MADRNQAALLNDIVHVNGAKVAYTSAGSRGTPVVLVHGGASDRTDWTETIPILAASHRVFAPDLIGFGESSRLDINYTMRDFSDFLSGFMDAVGIESAFMVGHSLGGRACLELAREAPERVSKMLLVAPLGFGRLSLPGFVLSTAAWALFKAIRRPLPYPSLDIELQENDLAGFQRVNAPALILWGRRDLYFSPKCGRRAAEAIPNSRLRLFGRSGHSPHRSEPAAFNEAALEFFLPVQSARNQARN